MSNNKIDEVIDNALTKYDCEKHIDIIPKIFSDNGLKDYFVKYCKIYGIEKSDGNFIPVEGGHFLAKELIETRFPYIALLYEGGVNMRLEYNELKTLLLYGLFHSLFNENFVNIHNSISEEKQISERELSKLREISNRKSFKVSNDIEAIIVDSVDMFFYYNPNDFTVVHDKIEKHLTSMGGTMDQDLCRSLIFSRIRGHQWKTRWAKLKSFKRNWPYIVKVAETKFISL